MLILILIALPIRLYIAATAGMISRDGAGFIDYARALARGPVAAMRTFDQHPLYPLLVLIVHGLMAPLRHLCPQTPAISDAVLGWQTAAMAVTLVSGVAAVTAMYAAARALFNVRVGVWAALLVALAAEFCQLSADALSDMTHLTLYLFALACAINGLRTGRLAAFAGAGVLSGLAFLCRPEGAEVAIAAFVLLMFLPASLLPWLQPEHHMFAQKLRSRFRCAIMLVVTAAIIASPYMLITGKLVRKKPVSEFVAMRTPAEGIDKRMTRSFSNVFSDRVARTSPFLCVLTANRTDQGRIVVATPCVNVENSIPRYVESRALGAIARSLRAPNASAGFFARIIGRVQSRTDKQGLVGATLANADASPLGLPVLAKTSDLPRPARAMLLIGEKHARSLRVTLVIPAFIFLALWNRRRAWTCLLNNVPADQDDSDDAMLQTRSQEFLAGFTLIAVAVLIHIIVLIRLLFGFHYWDMLSLRHVLVLGAMTIPFSAAGIVLLIDLIPQVSRRVAALVVLAVLIIPTLPWMFERRNTQDLYLRQAGQWIRQQQPAGAKILTTRNMVPFYANGVMIWSPEDTNVDRILAEARERRPDWLVFDEKRMTRSSPRFFSYLSTSTRPGETLELVKQVLQKNEDHPDVARIYRYAAPP